MKKRDGRRGGEDKTELGERMDEGVNKVWLSGVRRRGRERSRPNQVFLREELLHQSTAEFQLNRQWLLFPRLRRKRKEKRKKQHQGMTTTTTTKLSYLLVRFLAREIQLWSLDLSGGLSPIRDVRERREGGHGSSSRTGARLTRGGCGGVRLSLNTTSSLGREGG